MHKSLFVLPVANSAHVEQPGRSRSPATHRVVAKKWRFYARALEEAFSLAYGDDGATLDIAEIEHEEVNFADAFEMPF
ncbi:MAG TPA: hypothetical protein VKA90_03355 [Beijerinckiaceae bacterium]|nr:hypothetical protein [Beijerinckiaceae bacterium]